jgi:hypothetical protein
MDRGNHQKANAAPYAPFECPVNKAKNHAAILRGKLFFFEPSPLKRLTWWLCLF